MFIRSALIGEAIVLRFLILVTLQHLRKKRVLVTIGVDIDAILVTDPGDSGEAEDTDAVAAVAAVA